MRAADLSLDDVFEFEPSGGRMRFVGERVLLMDALAMGLLRKQLFDAFGLSGMRSILTRFGFSHGWRTAEALKDALPWDDAREWRVAGGRIHRLHGHVSFEAVPEAERTVPTPFADGVWKDSYEAEQHLLHLGRASTSVCWTLTGFASGYLSRVTGRTVYCLEESCVAQGAAVCRVVGHFKEDWPAERAAELAFFEAESLNETTEAVRKALLRTDRRLRAHRDRTPASPDPIPGLTVRSKSMRALIHQLRRVGAVDTCVVLVGEPGTGKGRLARHLHDTSLRQAGPFVSFNCSAAPEALLEGELFGAARGAFPGAATDHLGLIEAARGGTLVLEDVDALPRPLQLKLLRVLQAGKLRRLGERQIRNVDVRVVSTSSQSLLRAVQQGAFRADLQLHLSAIELAVPPLRERRDDILPLARGALEDVSRRSGLARRELAGAAATRLMAYPWPGNVRELLSAVEHAALLTHQRRIEIADLPDPVRRAEIAVPKPRGQTLADAERAFILATLAAEGGNRTRAAHALGIGTATLFRKLKAYRER